MHDFKPVEVTATLTTFVKEELIKRYPTLDINTIIAMLCNIEVAEQISKAYREVKRNSKNV